MSHKNKILCLFRELVRASLTHEVFIFYLFLLVKKKNLKQTNRGSSRVSGVRIIVQALMFNLAVLAPYLPLSWWSPPLSTPLNTSINGALSACCPSI